ncbi:MAG: hypothetical protein CFK49_02990 [Armatimonadetes bacterium JP3_11]|jgi:RsiW-degrading membrane proteinase PrsW (M82 family)|nr:MAG: hypothetical protein CFK49_02990 [Armatimonadetes bacterium JP3_11]RMH06129.1 MAG: hypothetical protein D6697_11300 [Armatimonadota bacterium]
MLHKLGTFALGVVILVVAALTGYLSISRLLQLPRAWEYYAKTPPMPPSGCYGLTGGAYWHCMVNNMAGEIVSVLFIVGISIFMIYCIWYLLRGTAVSKLE